MNSLIATLWILAAEPVLVELRSWSLDHTMWACPVICSVRIEGVSEGSRASTVTVLDVFRGDLEVSQQIDVRSDYRELREKGSRVLICAWRDLNGRTYLADPGGVFEFESRGRVRALSEQDFPLSGSLAASDLAPVSTPFLSETAFLELVRTRAQRLEVVRDVCEKASLTDKEARDLLAFLGPARLAAETFRMRRRFDLPPNEAQAAVVEALQLKSSVTLFLDGVSRTTGLSRSALDLSDELVEALKEAAKPQGPPALRHAALWCLSGEEQLSALEPNSIVEIGRSFVESGTPRLQRWGVEFLGAALAARVSLPTEPVRRLLEPCLASDDVALRSAAQFAKNGLANGTHRLVLHADRVRVAPELWLVRVSVTAASISEIQELQVRQNCGNSTTLTTLSRPRAGIDPSVFSRTVTDLIRFYEEGRTQPDFRDVFSDGSEIVVAQFLGGFLSDRLPIRFRRGRSAGG